MFATQKVMKLMMTATMMHGVFPTQKEMMQLHHRTFTSEAEFFPGQ
jgi:hypothetical protein